MAIEDSTGIITELTRVYSRVAMLDAQPLFTFDKFVELKEELGLTQGKTIVFPKLGKLGKADWIDSEYTPIPTGSTTTTFKEISVRESGYSVKLTQFRDTVSWRNEMKDKALLLGLNFREFTDTAIRDAFLSTPNAIFAGGVAGIPNILPSAVFTSSLVKDAVEVLKGLNAPQIERNGQLFYVCVGTTHQIRTLTDDPKWEDARKYVDPSDMYSGEVGRYFGVVFIETTQMPLSLIPGASGQPIHTAVIFGSRCVGKAIALPFELRVDPPEDLARFLRFGWYSIWGVGLVNNFAIKVFTS